MKELSAEAQEYFAETVSIVATIVVGCGAYGEGDLKHIGQMGKEVPRLNDQMFGITEAERNTYWCNMAMVRADYQGRGVAKAMFQLAFREAARIGATVALTTTNEKNVSILQLHRCYYYHLLRHRWRSIRR